MEVKIRDINMYYEEVGTGRPVLLLHGWRITGGIMATLFEPAFQSHPGWRRIYPDLPGHGKTPIPSSLQNQDDVIDIILEFMDKVVPGERFVVAGQSWGGYLARGVVQRRLQQIDGVMFYVSAIRAGDEKSDLPAGQVLHRDPAFAAALRPDEQWMLDDIIVVQSLPVLERIRAAFDVYGAPQDPAIVPLLDNKPFSFDPDLMPEPCPAPTLFLLGRQDNLAGYRDAWKVLDNYPRGTFAVLDRAGHGLNYEQPTLALALLSEWLDRVEEYIAQPN